MTSEEALAVLDALLDTRLKDVQELVFCQSWDGKTYQDMAEQSGYSVEHIRDVGFRLWQQLSHVLGEKVTKSNIQSILRQQLVARGGRSARTSSATEMMQQEGTLANPTAFIEHRVSDAVAAAFSSASSIEYPGVPVSLSSPFYIERPPIERRCYQEIMQPGALIHIKAPQKMGKTSLLNQILHYAVLQGYARVRLNLQQADEEALSDLNRFLRWFCKTISWKLNVASQVEDYWDEDTGLAKSSCTRYFEEYLLEKIQCPLVLGLDEVDRLFTYPRLAREFLPLLRVWHEEANESDIWQRLRLIVVHSTDGYSGLNVNQSPFNVGLSIRLPEWTIHQVTTLARCYDLNLDDGMIEQLMAITSGHPYLVQLAFYHLWGQDFSYQQLWRDAPTESGIYSHYLRRLLDALQANPELLTAMKQVLAADSPVLLDAAIAYQLQSMGLVKLNGNEVLIRCQLYRQYFGARL
jgi:hypothetical protein